MGIDEVGIDQMRIDKVGIDEVGIDKVGRYLSGYPGCRQAEKFILVL